VQIVSGVALRIVSHMPGMHQSTLR
jgi:hypothetical protein